VKSISIVSVLSLIPFFVTGCFVPQDKYDEATAKLREEEAARRGAELNLEQARTELMRIGQELSNREQSLSVREGELAQTKIDAHRLQTERDDASHQVEQLRGEIARAGDNLKQFSSERQELQTALAEAAARAERLGATEKQLDLKVLVMRDLALALGSEIEKGKVIVTLVDGKPAVRMPARAAFKGTEGVLSPEAVSVAERLGGLLASRPTARVELSDLSTDQISSEDRIGRLQKVADAMSGKGLAFERIGFAIEPGEGEPNEVAATLDEATGETVVVSNTKTAPATKQAKTAVPAAPKGQAASGKADKDPEHPDKAAQKAEPVWKDGPGSLQIVVAPLDT